MKKLKKWTKLKNWTKLENWTKFKIGQKLYFRKIQGEHMYYPM